MSKYMDQVGLRYLWGKLKALLATKASKTEYSVTMPAAGWSASAPYTQTVTVTGLTALVGPVADVMLSQAAGTAQRELEAWRCVSRLKADTGALTAICYDSKPEVTFSLRLLEIS